MAKCEKCGNDLPPGKRKYCIGAKWSCPQTESEWQNARHNIASKKRDKPRKKKMAL